MREVGRVDLGQPAGFSVPDEQFAQRFRLFVLFVFVKSVTVDVEGDHWVHEVNSRTSARWPVMAAAAAMAGLTR